MSRACLDPCPRCNKNCAIDPPEICPGTLDAEPEEKLTWYNAAEFATCTCCDSCREGCRDDRER